MSTAVAEAMTYRISALARGVQGVARAWAVVIPVIVVNAVLQAAIIALGVLPGLSIGFIALAALSYTLLVLSFVVVALALLRAIDGDLRGTSGVRRVLVDAPHRLGPALAWSLALVAAIIIGLALYVVPGLVVIALFPYLLIAVVDRRRHPLAVNFTTMGRRFWRWLLTIAVMGIGCAIIWFLATANGFFIAGPLGSLIAWLAFGVIAAWFTAAWALVYRAVNPATE